MFNIDFFSYAGRPSVLVGNLEINLLPRSQFRHWGAKDLGNVWTFGFGAFFEVAWFRC